MLETPGDWPPQEQVTIGVLAALPVEGVAMAKLIDRVRIQDFPGDPNTYRVGSLPSRDPSRPHGIALAVLPRDGTRSAANVCTNLLRTFPNVRSVIMMGIAGGVPRLDKPSVHVRLGDIVVANAGIVDYGHVRQINGVRKPRRSDGFISTPLVQAANELQMSELEGNRPWEFYLDPGRCEYAREYPRPDEQTDRLFVRGIQVDHPDRAVSGHPVGMPKIHYGAVGSADVLMRDEDERDRLATEFNDLLAVEMEGSGIAASTAGHDVSWFMVRGVVDYCETAGKNDLWHKHSSYATAAYVRALAAACRPYALVLPLVQQNENDHLVKMFGRVPAEVDLRAVWDAAVPHLPEPPQGVVSSTDRAYHYLSKYNAGQDGLPPVLAFVDELAGQVQEAVLAAELHHWVDQQAQSMRVEEALSRHRARPAPDDPAEPAQPGMLIEIKPVMIDRTQCEIMSWIQERSGPWKPRAGPGVPKKMALTDAESFVGDLIDRAEQEWPDQGDIAIEFLLPTSLLSLPVEWWRPGSPFHDQPLCVDYDVVVRSLERMRHGDRPRMWRRRWKLLMTESLRAAVSWGGAAETAEGLNSWEVRLREDFTMAVVVLSTPPEVWPGQEELNMALRAGVPVILWDRGDPRGQEVTQALVALLSGDPAHLPQRVRTLRTQAAAAAGPDQAEHPGRRVVLLLDNPGRVVAPRGTEW